MKSSLTIFIIVMISAVAYLAGEGIYSLSGLNKADQSLTYKALRNVFGGPEERRDIAALDPGVIVSERQIESLMEQFLAHDVGMGNSTFHQLKRERAAINYSEDGCVFQKPNLDKKFVRLRTMLFDPFDPVNAFYDWGKTLSPELEAFFQTYGYAVSRMRTNAWGERLTLPNVKSPNVVLVAGDSKAHGSGVDDADTLASHLQRSDGSVRYVNLGVAGAKGRDVICNLRRAGERYGDRIRGIIYVYCENDFDENANFGTPEEIVTWVRGFAGGKGINNVTFVLAPNIYNMGPELTRMRGYRGWEMKTHSEEKWRLKALVDQAGFKWFDIAELWRERVADEHSIFAGLSLFVDHGHLSPEGSRRLAEKLQGLVR